MTFDTAVKAFGILSISALVACGGGGSNPVTGGDSDDDVVNDAGTDPNVGLTDAAFLFDESRFLTANQFTFTPGATPGTGTIRINNLPFDNVSSEGGNYNPRAGVVLPNGTVYDNAGNGGIPYLAVVLVSPSGTGALVGAVGTDFYSGFGYGGAYASRPSAGTPESRTAFYRYNGDYNGIRVIRETGGGAATNTIQLTTGDVAFQVDLQDVDVNGRIRADITGRELFDANGVKIGDLSRLELIETGIDFATATSIDGTTRTLNADGSNAQTGTWEGLFSGPDGEEIVGYVVVEGTLSDLDPSLVAAVDPANVTGREVGGFIAVQQP
jgi:hypothetical protein